MVSRWESGHTGLKIAGIAIAIIGIAIGAIALFGTTQNWIWGIIGIGLLVIGILVIIVG